MKTLGPKYFARDLIQFVLIVCSSLWKIQTGMVDLPNSLIRKLKRHFCEFRKKFLQCIIVLFMQSVDTWFFCIQFAYFINWTFNCILRVIKFVTKNTFVYVLRHMEQLIESWTYCLNLHWTIGTSYRHFVAQFAYISYNSSWSRIWHDF